jgi:hypothetical protein
MNSMVLLRPNSGDEKQKSRTRPTSGLHFALLPLLLATCPTVAEGADWRRPFIRAKTVLETELAQPLSVALEQRPIRPAEFPLEGGGIPVAFLDRDRETLVVDPERCESLLSRARTIRQKEDAAFVLMLHELLHVYQHARMKEVPQGKVTGRWLRFVCEGHAIEFSHRLALAAGGKESTLANTEQPASRHFSSDFTENRDRLLQSFLYETSRVYVRANCRNLEDFPKLLEKAFTYAEVIGKGDPPTPSSEPGTRLARFTIPGLEVKRPMGMDYLDAMALVCPERFRQPDSATAYRGGALTELASKENGLIAVALFHFARQAAAAKLWQAARERCGRSVESGEHQSWMPADAKIWFAHQYPGRGRLRLMKLSGEFLLLVEAPLDELSRPVIGKILALLP